jgi:hypothetical protein
LLCYTKDMETQNTYTGPAYWLVNATSEHSFDLTDMYGKRVATYPNAELAHKVRKDMEKKALREYMKDQRKAMKA